MNHFRVNKLKTKIKITFYGAVRSVNGSKQVLTLNNGKKYLLDYGLFRGIVKQTDVMNRNFGFEASERTDLILSNAHIYHFGLIPKLVKYAFIGKVFCTTATKELPYA